MANYKTFAILAWHRCPPTEDIYLKDCIVSKIYYKGEWKNVVALKNKDVTFKEVFKTLKEKYGKKEKRPPTKR